MTPQTATIDGTALSVEETAHHTTESLHAIAEESLDETSATRHEPLLAADDEKEAEEALLLASQEEECVAAAEEEETQQQQREGGGGKPPLESLREMDPSMRVHRKVAEIAAKAYRRASEQSNVLSEARLADIALVRFDEIEVGTFLGKGSFSNVHEITKIAASEDSDCDVSWNGESDSKHDLNSQVVRKTKSGSGKGGGADPRKILSLHHRRNDETGTCRYAVKFLKEEICTTPEKYAVGTADLVVEGMFLASLAHPNIIKVKGLPEGGVKCLKKGQFPGYFLILDRLFDTLADRIYKVWSKEHPLAVKRKFLFVKDRKQRVRRDESLAIRLKVAFDISAALKFLHSKSIIYRDLKPENLGFDVRGDIKLFDLGLVKELRPHKRDDQGNYKLSMAGTPRYMAPECGMYQPYNLSADVYSFSMLLWEIISLVKPLKDFTYTQLKNEIFIEGERPPINKIFNKKLRALVSSGWSQTPENRPSIDQIYDALGGEYLRLAPAGSVLQSQMSHNRRRSTYVAQRITNMSVRHLMRLNTVESDIGVGSGDKKKRGSK